MNESLLLTRQGHYQNGGFDRAHLGNDAEKLSLEYAASLLPKVFLAGGSRKGSG